jgi:hypothetical protein
MKQGKGDTQSQRWTTNDELKWIQEWTPQGMSAKDKLDRLTKYQGTLDIRNIWKDDYGTSLDKSRIVSYVKRRIQSAMQQV